MNEYSAVLPANGHDPLAPLQASPIIAAKRPAYLKYQLEIGKKILQKVNEKVFVIIYKSVITLLCGRMIWIYLIS